jgi:benzoyl-CoA reductase/2-hydroxyglutaryl-CoA dehydratase subunit BcrC/BadD/HgdB
MDNKFDDFSVEYFVTELTRKKVSKEYLYKSVEKFNNPEELKRRIDYAINRIEKPLDFSDRILYFLVPFGLFHRLGPNSYDNEMTEKFEQGFIRQEKERLLYSLLGVFFYTVIIVLTNLI